MEKLSMKSKFLFIISALIVLTLVVGGVSFWSLKGVSKTYEHVAEINLPNLDKMSLMQSSVISVKSDLYYIGLSYSDDSNRPRQLEEIKQTIEYYEKADKAYNDIPFVEGEEALYNEFNSRWKEFKAETENILKSVATKDQNKREEFFKHLQSIGEVSKKYTAAIEKLMAFQGQEATKWSQDARAQATNATSVSIALILIGIIAGFAFSFLLTKKLSDQLVAITDHVGSASTQVSSASEQLSQSADQLSSVSQQQASSLEETSASLTEISGMAEANIKGAENADQTAKEVYEISEGTRKSMDELTTAMKSILDSNERIEKLVKVIEEIGAKTEIIDDIVFKTQLLSFNASVEAERAGEHGRGFAVVAQEVGNLAQMSGKAALEISGIVQNSIKEAESVASENKSRVESGRQLASETRDKMEGVLKKLTDILGGISKIVDASKEQGQGINQISTSVESISHLTQETAGTAEEAASASAELSGQAESLMDLVNQLKGIVLGAGHHLEAPTKANVQKSKTKTSAKQNTKVYQMKSARKPAKPTTLISASAQKASKDDSEGIDKPEADEVWEAI